MPERFQYLYLSDILESIEAIESFVDNVDFDFFRQDRKTFSASIRELEIIGEAVKNIPDDLKDQYPHVLWQQIRAFRNKITHEYFGIDVRIVWDVVINELPLLKQHVQHMMQSLNFLSSRNENNIHHEIL
ncbi:MAG: DUF86 domain-containing protein [Desulfatirhabdiaceae bacterium]